MKEGRGCKGITETDKQTIKKRRQSKEKQETMDIKHAAVNELEKQGYQSKEIAKALNYNADYIYHLQRRLRDRLPPIVTKKRAKLALKVLDVAMEGFTGKKDSATGEMKYDERVKPSDAIASSRIVVERGYPTEQAASGQGQSFTQINIEQVTLLSAPLPEKNPEEKEK